VDALIMGLSQHLRSVQESILRAATSDALALILSPVCAVAPRLMLRCIRHLMLTSATSTLNVANISPATNSHPNRGGGGGAIGGQSSGQGSGIGTIGGGKVAEDRARVLRGIVACQQR
jgi:hypothetical protein